MNDMNDWDDDDGRREDAQRFSRLMSEAGTVVRAWCQHFLDGGALGARPSLDERAGWTLSKLAPAARLRTPREPYPAFDDDATGD